MEMQGRAEDGIGWMIAREPHWSGDENFFKVHNWWHRSLYHLDLGQTRPGVRALRRPDPARPAAPWRSTWSMPPRCCGGCICPAMMSATAGAELASDLGQPCRRPHLSVQRLACRDGLSRSRSGTGGSAHHERVSRQWSRDQRGDTLEPADGLAADAWVPRLTAGWEDWATGQPGLRRRGCRHRARRSGESNPLALQPAFHVGAVPHGPALLSSPTCERRARVDRQTPRSGRTPSVSAKRGAHACFLQAKRQRASCGARDA